MDGTKEFTKKIPEFCVSIALCEAGVPVVGVIQNPVAGRLDLGVEGRRLLPRRRARARLVGRAPRGRGDDREPHGDLARQVRGARRAGSRSSGRSARSPGSSRASPRATATSTSRSRRRTSGTSRPATASCTEAGGALRRVRRQPPRLQPGRHADRDVHGRGPARAGQGVLRARERAPEGAADAQDPGRAESPAVTRGPSARHPLPGGRTPPTWGKACSDVLRAALVVALFAAAAPAGAKTYCGRFAEPDGRFVPPEGHQEAGRRLRPGQRLPRRRGQARRAGLGPLPAARVQRGHRDARRGRPGRLPRLRDDDPQLHGCPPSRTTRARTSRPRSAA